MFFTKLNNSIKPSEYRVNHGGHRVGALWEDDEYIISTLTARINKNLITE